MGNPAGVRRDFDALERRRFEALRLLEQGLNQSEVARRVRVVRQSVARWAALRRAAGRRALRQAGRAGRKPRLSVVQKARLERRLEQGPERLGYRTPLWTSERVAQLIREEFGVGYHPGHVWKLLMSLGGSGTNRPFVTGKRWPGPTLKKGPKNKGERSSCWTKAD